MSRGRAPRGSASDLLSQRDDSQLTLLSLLEMMSPGDRAPDVEITFLKLEIPLLRSPSFSVFP